MRRLRPYWSLLLVAGAVIALDQWTKQIVRAKLGPGSIWLPDELNWLAPYARIVHWNNSGAAFGMFQGAGPVFTVLALIVVTAILYYYPRVEANDWTLRLAMGLQMGGAIGNLIDRLTMGTVTDFISVATFPVFNIADASITVGVIVLLLGAWWRDRREKRASEQGPAAAESAPPVSSQREL